MCYLQVEYFWLNSLPSSPDDSRLALLSTVAAPKVPTHLSSHVLGGASLRFGLPGGYDCTASLPAALYLFVDVMFSRMQATEVMLMRPAASNALLLYASVPASSSVTKDWCCPEGTTDVTLTVSFVEVPTDLQQQVNRFAFLINVAAKPHSVSYSAYRALQEHVWSVAGFGA
jgi:hypothetical protein